MTETYTEDRWNTFENSGRVADYLYYRGIGEKSLSPARKENSHADNCGGSRDRSKGCGG